MVMREDPVERDAWILVGSLLVSQKVVLCSYDETHAKAVFARVSEIVGRDVFEVEP